MASDAPRQLCQRGSRQWHAAPGERHRVAPVRRRRQWQSGRRLLDSACNWRQPGLFPDVLGDCRQPPDRTPDERSDCAWRLLHRGRSVDARVEGRRHPGRARRAADERRPQWHYLSGHRCAGLYLDAGSRGAERVSLRPHPLRLPPGPVARRRRPRRSLGVDAIGGFFQPARIADVARQRSRLAAVLRSPLVPDADAERALPGLSRRQHCHQRQPAAGARALDEHRGRRAPRPRNGLGPHHRVQERARRCHLQYHAVDNADIDYT